MSFKDIYLALVAILFERSEKLEGIIGNISRKLF